MNTKPSTQPRLATPSTFDAAGRIASMKRAPAVKHVPKNNMGFKGKRINVHVHAYEMEHGCKMPATRGVFADLFK